MKLTVRRMKGDDPAVIAFNKKLEPKHYRESLLSKPTKGFHWRKTGRLVEIVFHFDQPFTGQTSANLSFTEHELFRMVKLCRRGRSDEAFLKAIEASDPDA